MASSTVRGELDIEGANPTFLADLLSAFLMHERCGAELYREVIERTKNPILKTKYQEFGKETQKHTEILTRVIGELGGNPEYVSPSARGVEMQDKNLVQATISLQTDDLMAKEMAMLDAVFVAESVDHANWQAVSKIARQFQGKKLGEILGRAAGEVEPEEDKHLSWASSTREKLALMQVKSSAMQSVGEKTEELMARVQEALRG